MMADFSIVPGLHGYQQQGVLNDQRAAQEMNTLGSLLNMKRLQQQMQQEAQRAAYEPEDRAMKQRLLGSQIAENEAQAAARQTTAQRAMRAFDMAKQISAMPDGPEKQQAVMQYRAFVKPESVFAETDAMNNPLGKLFKMKQSLPPGDPRHQIIDNAIRKESETAKQISPPVIRVGDSMGKIPAGYRATADGNLEAIPGGPADAKAQAQAALKAGGATDVDLAVSTLRDAYDRLEKGGGITNTDNSGIGNVLPSLSSSGMGQAAGKLFGTANQSARNDIAMTRPALLAALMKATGMSAKQMDSNAELKLWLATATDPTLDVGSNRRALNNIEKKYLGGSAAPTTGGEKTAASSAKPSMSEWMAKARAANPSASGAELEAYYYKKYGGK